MISGTERGKGSWSSFLKAEDMGRFGLRARKKGCTG